MKSSQKIISKLFQLLGSAKLALIIVAVLILLSLAGVLLPQQGRATFDQIHLWQLKNPTITKLVLPIGLFGVFQSWAFLAITLLLGINTIACTVKTLFISKSLRHSGRLRVLGFIVLHLSIIIILAGAVVSSAARFSGRIVLTEGQSFSDRPEDYGNISNGPLSPKRQNTFQATLKNLSVKSDNNTYPIGISAGMDFTPLSANQTDSKIIMLNHPVKYGSLNFTLNKIGFSPRIAIYKQDSSQALVNSFIALNTFTSDQGRKYYDFLNLPFFENTIYITLYPSHTIKDGKPVKTGESPDSPLIVIEMKDNSDKLIASTHAPLNGQTTIEEYTFVFGDIRRWAGFLVANDPGYMIVNVGLWLGLAALLLRYLPDLFLWFMPDRKAT